ncbi:MAG: BON domain-containing protein, partial [Syntrophales bacterium LBB04]|nr:BON domain-containing protein [Syntrophales bacterium LBB04]
GVKEVKNELTVAVPSKKTGRKTIGEKMDTIGGSIDDASITAQVRMALLFHRSTSLLNTKVETNNGVVTLYGKAKNGAEKGLVTKFVNDIHGV